MKESSIHSLSRKSKTHIQLVVEAWLRIFSKTLVASFGIVFLFSCDPLAQTNESVNPPIVLTAVALSSTEVLLE